MTFMVFIAQTTAEIANASKTDKKSRNKANKHSYPGAKQNRTDTWLTQLSFTVSILLEPEIILIIDATESAGC